MSFSDAFSTAEPTAEAKAETSADGALIGGGGTGDERMDMDTDAIVKSTESGSDLPDQARASAASDFEPTLPSTQTHRSTDDDATVEDADAVTAPPPSKKKKGTAATVRPGKKTKTGKTSSKPSSRKRQDGGAGSNAAKAPSSAASDGEDEGGSSDNGPYCICRGPDDHRWMISCDSCEDWFHGECVHITKEVGETLIQRYICPNCTDGKRYVTRYKKTCALEGCLQAARIHDPRGPSIFCGQDHCNRWWDQLVGTLPRAGSGGETAGDVLTQEDFMGLLVGTARAASGGTSSWKLGDVPFGTPTPRLFPFPPCPVS